MQWKKPKPLWEQLNPSARQMRRQPTPAEAALWARLCNRGLDGLKFRRQHPIGRFIVDFYCAEVRLVVEVDGGIHLTQIEHDRARDEYLEALELTVLHVTNEDALERMDSVLRLIAHAASPPPFGHPPAACGEGDGG